MNLAWRIYRRLAAAFPHEFKLAYGAEVTQLGKDVVGDIARRHGVTGLVRLILDIAMRLPLEYLSEMRRDMLYGLRALIKSPGFALVGIVSMGLGIGLTTNIYSSKWAILFRELPAAANAARLAVPEKPVSYHSIERYRELKGLFTGVAALEPGVPFNVAVPGDANAKPQRLLGQLVSADYFSVLGVRPQRGRLLSPALDRPGDAPVVVISDRFWRSRLGSAAAAIGQTLRLNGQIATIVGIAPRHFNGALAENPADLFVPITVPATLAPELANDVLHQRDARVFLALTCLAPGVTFDAAEAGLEAVTRRLEQEDHSPPIDKGRRVTLIPAGTKVLLPRQLRPVLAGFLGMLMGLIITLACTNLANMLIARGAKRRKEVAIRLAVGASRFRLIRQMVSEGLVLSLLGGAAGLVLAYGLALLHAHFHPSLGAAVEADPGLDWHAGVFAFGLALACGVGFSLAPALQATRADTTPALKEGSMLRLVGYRRLGLRNLLMVAQVAGSLMLLLITGFLVIGISKTSSVHPNFDPASMYLLSVDPVRDGYPPEKTQALFATLAERLKAAGWVRSFALAAQAPFASADEDGTSQLTAEGSGSPRVLKAAVEETVGAGYFAALSEPLLAGRDFAEGDQRHPDSRSFVLPVVLNETAKQRLFGGEVALGRHVRDERQSYEIVGVVRDLKNGLGMSQPVVYLPLTPRDFTHPPAGGMVVIVRSAAGRDAASGLRNEIASLDPRLGILDVQTLGAYLERSRSATRLAVQTYGAIGLFGLVLAAIGLAGITAYAVAQRRKEIALRTALGASRAQLLGLVLREGAALVSVGTVLGYLGAIAIARMLSALTNIFVEALSIGTHDPRLLVGAPVLLAAVAMLACWVPARRSAVMDPLQALRGE
jgi:predicted permease